MAPKNSGKNSAPKNKIEVIDEARLRKDVKTDGARGVYVLFGEEDYLKNYSAKLIRESVSSDPAFAVFNDIIIDGADFSPSALAEAMASFPFGADKKVIFVRSLSFSSMKKADVEALLEVLSSAEEQDYNVIVISVPSGEIDTGFLPDKPSPILSNLYKYATLVNFQKQPAAKLRSWVARHFEHFGVEAPPAVCSYLLNRCGDSMYVLSSEIEKVAFYVKSRGGSTVTSEDLDFVTVPDLSCGAFDLTNAVIGGDRAKAISVLEVLKFRKVEPQLILGEISATLWAMAKVLAASDASASSGFLDTGAIASATGMREFRVSIILRALNDHSRGTSGRDRLARAISLCAEADEMLKSSFASRSYSAIETLLCNI